MKNIKYIEDVELHEELNLNCLDVERTLAAIKTGEEAGAAYDKLIVNSQTYEGVQQKLDIIIPLFLAAGKSLKNIIIDEAWGAWTQFSSLLSKLGFIE